MASLPLTVAARDAALAPTIRSEPARGSTRSLLRRLYDAIIKARQLEADREIARYLELTGGKLTDSIEREIERRFISHSPK